MVKSCSKLIQQIRSLNERLTQLEKELRVKQTLACLRASAMRALRAVTSGVLSRFTSDTFTGVAFATGLLFFKMLFAHLFGRSVDRHALTVLAEQQKSDWRELFHRG
jgi:hypothetical protein